MAAEAQLKILEISHNKILIIAQSAKEEVCERSEEELVDMTEDMQYNKGCLQRMAQALMAHEIMWEAMEAAEKSSSKLIKLQPVALRWVALQERSKAASGRLQSHQAIYTDHW
jgi:hypothetical protein